MSPTWRRASGALSPVTNTSALATSAQARMGMSSGSGMEAFTGIQVAGIGSSADRAMSRSCHKAAETSIHHREMSSGRTSSRQIVRVPISLSLLYSRKTCGTKESEACQGTVRKGGRTHKIRSSGGTAPEPQSRPPLALEAVGLWRALRLGGHRCACRSVAPWSQYRLTGTHRMIRASPALCQAATRLRQARGGFPRFTSTRSGR